MRNGEKLTSDFGKKMRSSVLEEKKYRVPVALTQW